MAIFQLQAKDVVVRLNDLAIVNAVQNLSWEPEFNPEDQFELGNPFRTDQRINPEVSGSFDVTTTGAASSILSRMIYTLVGDEFTPAVEGNDTLIRETDLEFAVFDLVEHARANDVFDRSFLLLRQYLSGFTISASVDGVASETYNFEGDVVEAYRTPFHDVIPLQVTRKVGSETTVAVSPVGYEVDTEAVPDGDALWTIVKLMNGNEEIADTDITITIVDPDVTPNSGDETSEFDVSASGVPLKEGEKLTAIVYRKTPGAFPTISYPTTARFVEADQQDIWLVDPAVVDIEAAIPGTDLNDVVIPDSEFFLRIQSMDMTVELEREALSQIKLTTNGTPVYFRSVTFPISIDITLSALQRNLDDWARIQGKQLYGSDTAPPDILNLADFAGVEWQILTRYYKDGVLLASVAVLDARVSGRGQSVAVQGRSEVSWAFTGTKLAIQGKTGV